MNGTARVSEDRRSGPHILELLDVATPAQCSVRFITPNGERDTSFCDLWTLSSRAAQAIQASLPAGRVAGILTPSPEMVACMVGSLRSGRDFASLPLPGRGQDATAYARQLRTVIDLANVTTVIVESAYEALLRAVPEPLPCAVVAAETVASRTTSPLRSNHQPGELIQFSSGTTGTPKGLRISGYAIAASVLAMLDAFGIEGTPETYCGWLPLSHDMGLIGGLLGSWAACNRTRPGYRYVCISPELFLARPLVWLETCAAEGATVTGGPTFAYHILAKHLSRSRRLDLSKLRGCAVGAEMIGEETLESFAQAAARHGFRETALCPGYGLAEATLGVSMVRPGAHWSTKTVSVEGSRKTYVSCGPIFGGVRVQAPDIDTGAGPIRVAGSVLCSGYFPGRDMPADGWLDTGDLGVMADGELVVTGRADDLLCLAGRNVFAWELEGEASTVPGVGTGACAAVADGTGRYVVFFEARAVEEENLGGALSEIRLRLARLVGMAPAAVGCLERGMLPKTPSGKIRRKVIAADLSRFVECCRAYKEF